MRRLSIGGDSPPRMLAPPSFSVPISNSPCTPSKWSAMRVKLYSNDSDIQFEAAQYFRLEFYKF